VKPVDVAAFASGALSGNRRRTLLALLGVTIGVAAVIVLTALGEGARRYVIGEFAEIGSNLLIVFPGKNETTGAMPGFGGVPNDLTLEDAEVLEHSVPQIAFLAPLSTGNDNVSYRERRRQVAVLGSTSEFRVVHDLSVAAGGFLPDLPMDRGASVAVLGAGVARELFQEANPLGAVIRIADWRMRVIGVLEPKGTHFGMDMDDVVIVPVATGMQMFNRSSLFRILIKVQSGADLQAARERVLALLLERHGEEDVTCITQDAVVSSFSAIITVLTAALAGIAAISLTVAGIGIMNVMLVSVSERRREIGLLKAIGAGARQVLSVFLLEAVLLSSAGGLAGLLLGWAGVRLLVRIFPDFPASPPAWAVGSAIGVSVLVGAVFGLLPAWKATRVDPIEALAGR
jgi:putative ABC transport system permease protein